MTEIRVRRREDGAEGTLVARVTGLAEGTRFRVRWDHGPQTLCVPRDLDIIGGLE